MEENNMKRALVIVDYQNDFVHGSLGFPRAQAIEEAIVAKIEDFLAAKDDLFFTFDTHGSDYLETREGQNLPVAHCIRGTEGWEIFGRVAQYLPAAQVFHKTTFGSLELAAYLQRKQYDAVELAGLVSNICVLSNAVLAKAALPEADIVVDALATASVDEAAEKAAFDVLQGLHIRVVNR
jgi:nicotinamidase-related amidase